MVKYHIDDFAKQHAVDNVTLKTLHEKLDEFLPPIFLGATVEAGVYAISCLLMLIGACCNVGKYADHSAMPDPLVPSTLELN